MSRTALLIVDMQKGAREWTSLKPLFDKALWNINEISQMFRKENLPVIVIQHCEVGGQKNEHYNNVDELIVSEKDYRIEKNYFNAFWKTDLDEILKKEDVDCVIVGGFAAEFCVTATCNGALERGYNVLLMQNGIAGLSEEGVKVLHNLRPLISLEALKYFVKG